MVPTYRILSRRNNAVLAPSIVTDSEISAGLEYLVTLPASSTLELTDIRVEETSPAPVASVYTVVEALDVAQGGGLKEVCTTGSRQTAISEAGRNKTFSVIEESREQNRIRSKDRK